MFNGIFIQILNNCIKNINIYHLMIQFVNILIIRKIVSLAFFPSLTIAKEKLSYLNHILINIVLITIIYYNFNSFIYRYKLTIML